VVVGGGPTGVELAGALGELAHKTLKDDFRSIDPTEAQIFLLEGLDRILPPYPADLSAKATVSLEKLGVTVQPNTLVTDIQGETITLKQGDTVRQMQAQTVLWAAGVKASPLGMRPLHNSAPDLRSDPSVAAIRTDVQTRKKDLSFSLSNL
jgi:NADH dehydrogenase